jgi:hypothetical protein
MFMTSSAARGRRQLTRPFLFAALALAAVAALAPSAHAAPAVLSAQVLAPPSPVLATDARRHLVYEIQLDNTSDATVTVERLVVRDTTRSRPLLSLGAEDLPEFVLGASGPTTTLAPGDTAFVFLDVVLPARGRVPHHLTHRLALSVQRLGRPLRRRIAALAPTRVGHRPAAVVGAPLRGERFIAADACCARGVHAHSLAPFDGRWVSAQRYAIDWLQLNESLTSSSAGDPTRNESYLIWGEDILAVAPGTIVATRDDLPDNTPPLDPPEPAFDDLTGNRVVQDIGGGRVAVYAHLQQGGVNVHVGDRVRRGDVLGQVGNSGGSSEPHLHFHIMDGPGGTSAIAANALPFVFEAFRLDGSIHDFETGEVIPAPPPPVRRRQLLLTGDITDFGPGG